MKTLEEAWKILVNWYGDYRMQFKCLMQKFLYLKMQHKQGHQNIISLATAVNWMKSILDDLRMKQGI